MAAWVLLFTIQPRPLFQHHTPGVIMPINGGLTELSKE
jgi:hypothetical protein